ncbi:hypothetical protein L873DRAFT_108371 [Choiromyces venosus 120613-1]|uniref:Uncharacterized protein n=1 Tax=Choiromyces venosus 120613-1 TaxID=1336337 RepID=A0A3N4J4M2_9PEZI|nr:hypothetical protein L873DRAFT_108371 [Choiromyces venosus 120613-1]
MSYKSNALKLLISTRMIPTFTILPGAAQSSQWITSVTRRLILPFFLQLPALWKLYSEWKNLCKIVTL